MTNIQIMNEATKLKNQWEAQGQIGFFVEFYTKQTGNEMDSKAYELVIDMIEDDMI